MKLTQIRNATVLLDYGHSRIVVDPMLAPQGTLPSLKWLTSQRRRNPLVELPAEAPALLDSATHALITHCRKGHFDHLDRAGKRWLRERQLPVLCMPDDADYLRERGLNVQELQAAGPTPFGHGSITPVPCLHGEGWIGRLMAHGHGYLIEQPGEPSIYLAGDTVLCEPVRQCVRDKAPAVCVVPAGGAAMDLGGELIMDGPQALELAALGQGTFIANHLEALDHCPTPRSELVQAARHAGLAHRFHVPADGETLEFLATAA